MEDATEAVSETAIVSNMEETLDTRLFERSDPLLSRVLELTGIDFMAVPEVEVEVGS